MEAHCEATLYEELKEDVMTLKEQYPAQTRTLERLFFGRYISDIEAEIKAKNLAEIKEALAKKEAEQKAEIAKTKKRQVILLHQKGMKETDIATIVEMKQAEVQAIIKGIAKDKN